MNGIYFFKEPMLSQRGFTLVELSIVIIIIGLIIAGVTQGRDLIARSKIQSIIAEQQKYKLAIDGFRFQFEALPGDFSRAQTFWPVSTNGNGNGFVTGDSEGISAWFHLQLGGFIQGNYNGASPPFGEIPGVHVGYSHYHDKACYHLFGYGNGNAWTYGGADYFDKEPPLLIGFGRVSSQTGHRCEMAVLKSSDAYTLDQKIDDGLPHTGWVMADAGRGLTADATVCNGFSVNAAGYNASVHGNANYVLTPADTTLDSCRIMFEY